MASLTPGSPRTEGPGAAQVRRLAAGPLADILLSSSVILAVAVLALVARPDLALALTAVAFGWAAMTISMLGLLKLAERRLGARERRRAGAHGATPPATGGARTAPFRAAHAAPQTR